MEEEYRIERIGPDHYGHLVKLIHRCFGRTVTLSSVKAKFDTSMFGARDIGFMAFASSGQPAAYYGVFPIQVTMNGQQHLAAQSGDTMTDPDHQRKGLFTRLARKTYDLAATEGVRFVFGFPNENSYHGFASKLNWTFTGRLREFRTRTGGVPLCEFAGRFPWSRPLYGSFLSRKLGSITVEQGIDDLGGMRPGQVCVSRTENFLRYKSAGGARMIRFMGFTMLIRAEVHLFVGDVMEFAPERIREFQRTLIQLGRRLACGQVVLTLSTNHWLFPILALGPPPVESLPIGHVDLSSHLPIDHMAYSRADLDTF